MYNDICIWQRVHVFWTTRFPSSSSRGRISTSAEIKTPTKKTGWHWNSLLVDGGKNKTKKSKILFKLRNCSVLLRVLKTKFKKILISKTKYFMQMWGSKADRSCPFASFRHDRREITSDINSPDGAYIFLKGDTLYSSILHNNRVNLWSRAP